MKIVIIDDARPVRDEVRGLLSGLPNAEVVGESGSVAEALRVVKDKKPDLIFLAHDLSGGTGFEFLTRLPLPHPRVIFLAAPDTAALRTLEVNALEFLLKPLVPERFAEAFARALNPPKPTKAGAALPLPVFKEDDSVYLCDEAHCWFVPVKDIRLLEGDGNHTRFFFENAKPLLYRSLVSIEARLPATLFTRANRVHLVNRLFVKKEEPWFSGGIKVTLSDGKEVEFSRRQAQVFHECVPL